MAQDKKRLQLIQAVQKELTYSRFVHTLGVAATAAALAERYGADMEKADTAGILHDCAKYKSTDEMEHMLRSEGYSISPLEKGNGALLHAKAGSVMAKKQFGIEDEEILGAIAWHTTGKPDMTLLEKILYVADYIEPGRNQAPNLEKIRVVSFENLDRALCMILKDTLDYLDKSGAQIDGMTKKTYEYYRT